ncbi:MAG: Helicase associated domain protein [Oscillospiraceae bacterium]|nr:Helicase associated domain protein [Oscillospiraceae bacterium]
MQILFPHNQTAYEAACAMLVETGKACVIHPTGTGKSFIGFQLCADHPEAKVLWLSPSEYIFRTQLENWQSSGGSNLSNIIFLTYAKLMLLSQAEIDALQPSIVVVDEFHRSGAAEWQKGVTRLLTASPPAPPQKLSSFPKTNSAAGASTPYTLTPNPCEPPARSCVLLGLTATNIRYLDNQRDMADELFENNIASQMTLGDAIVRGILTPPKYVLSVFRYQQSLEKLELRVRGAKSKASRDAAQEYLEKLRRALENSIGLPEIFSKHMPDYHGKYLVFCSNAEHMDEMIEKAGEWFSQVDPNLHIYRAYAEDPATFKAFQSFKSDNSDHLKLLYCIDMLNEGIHISDVNGVILLRPTVSPIIYKQQIGRALSATHTSEPVIFDIVLNIENLYSISTIQQEMQAAITYYHYLGDDSLIVNDRFEVIDETRDCRRLFDALERSLDSSWNLMYAEAKEYYLSNGNLQIPYKYKTESGLSLGSWLNTQRKIYHGQAVGHLSDEQIDLLNNLGIVWDSWRDLAWERNYLAAKAYYEKNGNLLPPRNYVDENGVPLGLWVMTMRTCRANHKTSKVTPERIAKLDAIGMVWNNLVSEQWEKNYLEAAEYFRQHGDLRVPGRYVTPSGIKLGNWIVHLRLARKGRAPYSLTQEQIARLDLIGMVWDAIEDSWNTGYQEAKTYYLQNHTLKIPAQYTTPSGFSLGVWISKQRVRLKKGQIPQDQIDLLNAIGMYWDVHSEKWQEMYSFAESYYSSHGDLKIPRNYRTPSGARLDSWLGKQRRDWSKLSASQQSSLRSIGVSP